MTSKELKDLKTAAGVTWQYEADQMGVHPSIVYRWANGQVDIKPGVAIALRQVLR